MQAEFNALIVDKGSAKVNVGLAGPKSSVLPDAVAEVEVEVAEVARLWTVRQNIQTLASSATKTSAALEQHARATRAGGPCYG